MSFGLDKFGFSKPNQADLKADMETRSKELYGDDVNLSPKSFIGITLGLFSWFLSKVWELAEKVYHSGHVSEAEGVQLDYLTPFYNTSRKPEQYAEVELTFTGTPNFTIYADTRFETESGIDFALKTDVVLDATGYGIGEAVSLSPGLVGNVLNDTITVQSEPSADVLTVNNVLEASGGREEETDSELSNRLLGSDGGGGSGTINSIISDVLSVSGVRAANISVNNTMTDSADGIPPKSYQVYALGGDDQDIAEAIFKNYTGIRAFGTTLIPVLDIAGNTHTIGFTRATAVDIFATITITTDNTFEADGITQIKDAIISVIGGTSSNGTLFVGLNMGDDVIRFQIEKAIGQIQGVIDASVTIGKAVDAQTTSNIAIESNEVAQLNASNVSVVIA
jgi:uncharacterized phage protein gp47/JayE